MIHIEDMDEGWVYFKYERLPTFCYRCGILGHQDCECQQINKGCFHTVEDEFEFGPWLHFVAPKTNHKKGSSSKQRFDDDEEEDNLIIEGEEDIDRLSKHRQQSRNSPMPSDL